VKLEIAVNAEFVKPTIEAITEGARTGKIGDGKIFVLDLEAVTRIRTGETGNVAIG
jgi:nitrogen regulatory protein P-II 2